MGIRHSVAALKPYLSRRIRIKFQSVQILEVFPDGERGEILAMTMTQLLAFVYSALPDTEAHKQAAAAAAAAAAGTAPGTQTGTGTATASDAIVALTAGLEKSSTGAGSPSGVDGDAGQSDSIDRSREGTSGDRGSGGPPIRSSSRLQGCVRTRCTSVSIVC